MKKDNCNIVSSSASRKLCNICNSANHLTHNCKVVTDECVSPKKPDLFDLHEQCGVAGCGICLYNMIRNFTVIPSSITIPPRKVIPVKSESTSTASPSLVRKETLVVKSTDRSVRFNESPVSTNPVPTKFPVVVTPVKVTATKSPGPKLVWVPKKN